MTLQFLRCSSFSNILVILPFLFLMLSQFFQKHIGYNNTTHHYLQILTNSLSCPYLVFSLSDCCYCLMEDHSEYNITTYVLAIHYHILNSQNNNNNNNNNHPHLLLCCSGAARLAPFCIGKSSMASVKHLIIYYHNHYPQKQCMDMAPHVLEQMSQTVTTPHPFTTRFPFSLSTSKLRPPSVVT